jgi:hypothetical protein
MYGILTCHFPPVDDVTIDGHHGNLSNSIFPHPLPGSNLANDIEQY